MRLFKHGQADRLHMVVSKASFATALEIRARVQAADRDPNDAGLPLAQYLHDVETVMIVEEDVADD